MQDGTWLPAARSSEQDYDHKGKKSEKTAKYGFLIHQL